MPTETPAQPPVPVEREETPSPAWAGEGGGRSRGFSRHADCLRSGSPMQRTARTASEGGAVKIRKYSIDELHANLQEVITLLLDDGEPKPA